MKEIMFLRIDYDTKEISQDSIVDNLVETIEHCPERIKTHFTLGLNEGQANSVSNMIKETYE